MEAKLQGIEVEPFGGGDDDLAIDHALLGQPLEQRVVELGEVPVERLRVSALDVEVVVVPAIHDGPEPVPLGLEQEITIGGQGVRERGEHRLDGRIDREVRGGTHEDRV